MSVSLMKILDDPSLLFDGERLKKITKEVVKDKNSILKSAEDYNNKYKKEIEEGTIKRQLMIEDGARRGLKEEDVCAGSFVPTVRTPILNWLYFLLQENNDNEFEETRKQYENQYRHLTENYEEKIEIPEMDSFIYGNMTHKQFQTIKKLKTLALNSKCNENESILAFTMCKELCDRYGLEFDKIPINN